MAIDYNLFSDHEEKQNRETIDARANYQNWFEGGELEQATAKSFLSHKDVIRELEMEFTQHRECRDAGENQSTTDAGSPVKDTKKGATQGHCSAYSDVTSVPTSDRSSNA